MSYTRYMTYMAEFTTIRIEKENRDALEEIRQKKESYNEVIKRLIKKWMQEI